MLFQQECMRGAFIALDPARSKNFKGRQQPQRGSQQAVEASIIEVSVAFRAQRGPVGVLSKAVSLREWKVAGGGAVRGGYKSPRAGLCW